MEKLSVVAFSRNDYDKAILFVKELYPYCEEIVIVDSSDRKDRERFIRAMGKYKKLKVYYALAIGYPDPIFMYGINKCSNKWVLYLDTDERMSSELEKKVHEIISTTDADAINIKRYEEVQKQGDISQRGTFFTWQIHLFKKGAVEFQGLIHEQPKVYGKLDYITDNELYLEHVVPLMEHQTMEYHRMEKYERFCYRQYNSRIVDYFGKVTLAGGGKAEETTGGRLIRSALLAYEALGGKKKEQEVSNLDYWLLFLAKNYAYEIKAGSLKGFLDVIPRSMRYMKRLREWQSEPDGKENFLISRLINDIGITKFLRLDDERNIKRMNRLYMDKEPKGLKRLMELMTMTYRSRQRRKG
ncbi:MAG: hypothetical protein KGH54_03700 [Candidatus Micrarchaeota archaeon]|nr:hypothetical protein [Candidatus Micrarchaeota archaeon]